MQPQGFFVEGSYLWTSVHQRVQVQIWWTWSLISHASMAMEPCPCWICSLCFFSRDNWVYPNSVPMSFIVFSRDSWFLGINIHKYPLYRAYIGISHFPGAHVGIGGPTSLPNSPDFFRGCITWPPKNQQFSGVLLLFLLNRFQVVMNTLTYLDSMIYLFYFYCIFERIKWSFGKVNCDTETELGDQKITVLWM